MPTELAIPQTESEMREMLTDRRTMRAIYENPDSLAKWIQATVNARLKNDPSLLNEAKEQQQAFFAEWLRDQRAAGHGIDNFTAERLNLTTTGLNTRITPTKIYNKDAVGAPFDSYFRTSGEFMRAVTKWQFRDAETIERMDNLSNALSSVRPSDGGFVIPEILRGELLRVTLERAIVRSRARVVPMDSLTVPFPVIKSTSNVSSVYGGFIGYWTEEGATLTESSPKFSRVVLKAGKLVLYTEIPNELIRDSIPAFNAFIMDALPEALAFFEDVACFTGGGVGEPLGFLNSPSMVSVTRSTTVAGNNVEWVDIANMYARLLPQSISRAVWVVSPDVLPSLLTMQVASGSNAVWLGGGAFPTPSLAPPMSMLGLPILVTEKARTVGSAGDISLVDFGYYLFGDRQAMSARQSEDFKFNTDETALRVIERIDGRPWLQSAITPQNGGNSLSAFVQLAAA